MTRDDVMSIYFLCEKLLYRPPVDKPKDDEENYYKDSYKDRTPGTI
jgi:hypothetical protein